ncbi:IS3 family transposase [Planomonospora sp. ID67723]|uniref:IS3 family transposase n=1 Tax=Planomonospora sp. ID67723 TaxID=2738134 RepID=UPI0018C37BDE|nr:IS3 family transposase [Planomonospora sp. ID67723]MBG0831525.1 IS3 family transposase [Planomonospora sp. ID67723]
MTLAKFELIDAEKAHHKIAEMCAWLGASRSGYYEWRTRPASATAQRRVLRAAVVAEIFADAHETYGYRRVHAALLLEGYSEEMPDELAETVEQMGAAEPHGDRRSCWPSVSLGSR